MDGWLAGPLPCIFFYLKTNVAAHHHHLPLMRNEWMDGLEGTVLCGVGCNMDMGHGNMGRSFFVRLGLGMDWGRLGNWRKGETLNVPTRQGCK